ncbi:uncharacterized protein FIBRA_05654 [Fibroporia radiculosa]|uniref:Zn(2)-C6 fungal-type domain-containing protein n=1 Tax=Fibroporia radiculosa TaxID=599839 RepID=J4GRE3_9APHY|nr:uncharacterized protein FIBRA_05654 [Fibroporia radiculosa]CCM03520.1 predicted protein [Fibroporia radiculosa]
MSGEFPNLFPVSHNRSYVGGGDIHFVNDAIEYSHACYAYQPSEYGNNGFTGHGSFSAGSSTTVLHPGASSMSDASRSTPQDTALLDSSIGHGPHASGRSSLQLHCDLSHLPPHPLGNDQAVEPMSASSSTSEAKPRRSSAAPEKRTGKSRREKLKLELAPDQPLTTQGKPRTRVYVACVQCRSRKIRCDGAKPVCHNCSRRTSGDACSYDVAPKRRGPDKTPGARQRTAGMANTDGERPRRRRRTTAEPVDTKESSFGDFAETSRGPGLLSAPPHHISLSPRTPSPQFHGGDFQDVHATSNMLNQDLTPISISTPTEIHMPMHQHSLSHPSLSFHKPHDDPSYTQSELQYETVPFEYAVSTLGPTYSTAGSDSLVTHSQDEQDDAIHVKAELPSEPSLRYARDTWWDVLLGLYATSYDHPHGQPFHLTPGARHAATQQVHADLRFLLRYSSYWLSFINIPRLLRRLRDPESRCSLQPSFVWSVLALATFLQSSDGGHGAGAHGRDRALKLKEEAQCALEASLTASWVDDNLAQASWMIAFFEVCTHPLHATQRVRSSLSMLDSLLRYLSLATVDRNDPRVTVFPPRCAPVIAAASEVHHRDSQEFYVVQHSTRTSPSSQDPCWCASYTFGQMSPSGMELAPLWSHTPAWINSWTEGEIQKEECRRLVWSSVMLIAGYTSYNVAASMPQIELFAMDPANYAVLFPGESLMSSSNFSPKESVWALYMRSLLLWNSCVRMYNDLSVSDAEKGRFVADTWQEIDTIEQLLSRHKCNIERTFMFVSRDYLFITRLYIYREAQRFAPHLGVNAHTIRQKAEEWLTHHNSMAKRTMYGLHTVTGQPTSSLSGRPFYFWWFLGHVFRSISTLVSPSRHVQSLVDLLLRAAPLKNRPENERLQADELYRTGLPLRIPSPRQASPEPTVTQRNANYVHPCPHCTPDNSYGWRCPQPIVDPDVDPDNAFHADDGTPPGHAYCGNCENILGLQAPSTTKCDMCQVSFCGVGVPSRCVAAPLITQHPHGLSDLGDLIQCGEIYDCFDGNTVEVDIMLDYLTFHSLTPRHIYREIVLHLLRQPRQFAPLIELDLFMDVHNVAGGTDPDPTAPRHRICRVCATEVLLWGLRDWWIRERRKGLLEEWVTKRPDCPDGSGCTRQKDHSHAKELNHMIIPPDVHSDASGDDLQHRYQGSSRLAHGIPIPNLVPPPPAMLESDPDAYHELEYEVRRLASMTDRSSQDRVDSLL